MPIPTFREVKDVVHRILREEGGLGVLLVDLAPLARVERSFGPAAYQGVRRQLDTVMGELVTSVVRSEDILTRHESEGDRFLIFLAKRRDAETRFRAEDLHKLCDRVEMYTNPRVARLTQTYMRERHVVDAGYGFVLFSPLESEERQILRLVDDAFASAELRRNLRERDQRERLQEVIYNRDVWTVFQDIKEIATKETVAHEALSRGPRGSDLQAPLTLFGHAARYGVTEELERACRKKAFEDWEMFGAPTRLFVNTVPATVRDPSFLGKGVLDYLGPRLSPKNVTLEITERQVIENLGLYREAMHSFTEMGFSFAIDDLGAGYSGLETLAQLGATYLKIDMGLVRGVHQKKVSQQIIKAILDMSNGVGAAVIAEGIETQEEADALMDMGVRFGQGYLWGRPHDPYVPKPVATKAG